MTAVGLVMIVAAVLVFPSPGLRTSFSASDREFYIKQRDFCLVGIGMGLGIIGASFIF